MFCLEFIDCKEHLGFGGGRGADQDQDQDCATWWQNSGPTETREPIIKILKNCAVFLFLYLFFRSKYSMFWDQVFFVFFGSPSILVLPPGGKTTVPRRRGNWSEHRIQPESPPLRLDQLWATWSKNGPKNEYGIKKSYKTLWSDLSTGYNWWVHCCVQTNH